MYINIGFIRVKTDHALDNIEMVDVDGVELLSGGSMPLLYTAETVCAEGLGLKVRRENGQ